MADYTLVINTRDEKFVDTIGWSASSGDGLSSGDPLVLQVGDRVRVQNVFTDSDGTDSFWNGSATIQGWQSGYWNSTSNLVVNANTTSAYKTVQSAAGGQTDSITAVDTSGANPGNISSVFYMSFAGATDQIPDDWNWTDPSGQELGVLAYSQTHTLAGMDTAANLTFSGNTHNTAQMSINGATWTAVSTVSVTNGTTIRLRALSSGSYSTTTTINTAVNGTAKGSGFSITTRAANKNPTNWNWTDPSGQELGVLAYSQTHTLAGMDTAANLTFSGNTHNTAQMSINGATWTAVSTVSVTNGTTIRLRALSSGSYSTTTTINTAVNGAAEGGAFNITTRAKDVTPVFPAFTAVGSTTPGQSYQSNTVTISGIDPSVPVSITSDSANFAYKKNTAAYTSAAGTASNNDTFTVSHTAKPAGGAVTTTTLTIGDTSKSYVTTNAAAGTGMSVSPITGSDVVDEGETATFVVTSFSQSNTYFWWDVSPTDVNTSSGNSNTVYSAGSSKPYIPPTNTGGFSFTPTLDYIDDGAAGTGAETYTVTLYSDSGRNTVTASTTIQVNDNGQPIPPDLAIGTISNIVKDYGAGASHAVTVSSGNAVDVYSTFLSSDTSFGTPLENSTSAGNRILTVNDDSVAAGGSKSYVVAARRPVASNGNNQYYATNQSYTVYRRPGTATFYVSDDDAAANSVTVTLNITANADGYNTYQYRKNAGSFVATNTFNHLRTDSTSDYYVRAIGANGYVNTTDASVLNYSPGYIDPTISGAIANQTIDWDATTALVAFTAPTANHKYVVRSNNGTTNRSDERTTAGNFTVSSGLPSVGAALTFELFTYLIATKGGLETYVQTDATCTITRSVEPLVAPDTLVIATVTTAAELTNVTATASGGSGGTLQVSPDNSNWYTNGTSFGSRTRGVEHTWYARRVGAGSISASISQPHTPGYIANTINANLAGTNDSITTLATTASTTISNVTANHTYVIRNNNGGTNRSATFTTVGAKSITSGLPAITSAGGALTFEIFHYRNANVGGLATFVGTDKTFTVTRAADTAIPVITVTGGTVNVIVGNSYTDQGATATDNVDGNITASISTSNPVNTAVVGSYTVTYNVSDGAGNAATEKTRTVNVTAASFGAFNSNPTGVELSSTNYAYSLYTGGGNVIASTNGAPFFVTANTNQPNVSLFNTSSKNISNGNYLHIKQTASGSYNTAVNTTISAGGASVIHTVTTRAKDVTPVFPAFTAVGSTTPGQSYQSNTVTISGIDPSVPVSITSDSANFAYKKNTAAYTSAAGTASNNDTFTVSHTAKPAGGAVTTTTLTIGDTSKSYVTTNAAAGTGMSVSPITGSDVVDEGETATFVVTSFSQSNTYFWWDVSPTDVNTSSGNSNTVYSAGSSKPYIPPTNTGGFSFTPTLDYIDDGAAGTGAETYTVTLYSDSGRNTVTASTTIQVNDNGQPIPPDLAIGTISNIVKDYGAGASHAVTVSSGNAVDVYSTFLSSDTSFGTPLENSTSAGNRILTVNDDSVAAGGSKSYVVAARRPVASNGNNQYYATNQSYTVYRRPGTATFYVSDDDAAANSVTVTLNITANADGYNTYQYRKNAGSFVATNTFNHLRTDSTSDYYVRAIGANGYVNTTDASVLNYSPGYIDPTISGAIANQTIDWDATTALVAFTAPTANHKYVVRSNNGTTNRSDERTTAGNFTVSSGLPSVGAALTFELFTYLIATKGGLETYVQTDATCTITRSVQPVSTPTGISVTNIATTADPNTTVTIEASGGSGGYSTSKCG